MRKERGLLFAFLTYIAVLAVPVLAVGAALSNVSLESLESRAASERERTILDERIANAREIKAALSKPIPRPEPLPPITAKRSNPVPAAVAAQTDALAGDTDKPKKPKLSPAARNALAMEHKTDAHANRPAPTFDRAVGAW
jgi:hypothetical protein